MILEKLTTEQQFLKLNKGDILVIEWGQGSSPYRHGKFITHEPIWGLNSIREVITNKAKNYYFSIERYLEGLSGAKEIYLIKEGNPQTNFNKIKAMTVDEMALFMFNMVDCVSCTNKLNRPYNICNGDGRKCLEVTKEWLESEG